MADTKISALTALTAAAAADVLPIVDTSATATKKMTIENMFKNIPVSVGVNEGTPLAKLHVVRDAVNHSTQSSLAPIFVEDDNRPGIFFSGNLNNIGIIQFGDNSSINAGEIFYAHSDDKFSFRCAGTVQATVAQAINGSLKRWTAKTANYTSVAGDRLLADTATSGAFTITLPSAPAVGDEIHILDSAANFDNANLTVARNGKKIQGATADLTITTENTGIGLVFMSDTYGWRILVDAYGVDPTEL